jgi:MFS family permease
VGVRYHLLLVAYVTSSLGNWVYQLTLPLFVLKLTGSALSTGAVYAIEYGPFLLLSLVGGVVADRFERRRLLVTGDATAGLIAASLGVLVAAGTHSVWPIFAAAFLLACVDPLYHPAFFSFLPRIVTTEQLGKANGWLQAGDNITSLAGPAAAGGMITIFGYQTAIFIDAATFFASALLITMIRVSPGAVTAVARTARSVAAEIGEAVRYIKDTRVLLAGSLLFTGTNFGIWLVQANFVFYLTRYRHMGPTLIGIIMAAQGAGAILGAMAASRVMRRLGSGPSILACTAAAGLGTVALIPMRDPVTIGVTWALVYAFGSVNVVAWFTLRQRFVPDRLMGRVVATTRMIAYSSIPVAALLAGALESALRDMYVIIALGGLFRFAIAIVSLRTPLRQGDAALARTAAELTASGAE